eukprot:3802583-Prymnesium_polylepis.1
MRVHERVKRVRRACVGSVGMRMWRMCVSDESPRFACVPLSSTPADASQSRVRAGTSLASRRITYGSLKLREG